MNKKYKRIINLKYQNWASCARPHKNKTMFGFDWTDFFVNRV